LKAILTDIVAVGNATARVNFFHSRTPDAYVYEGSYWKTGFIGGDYQWLKDGGAGGRSLFRRRSPGGQREQLD